MGLDFTTVAKVKAHKGVTDSSLDSVIQEIITSVSQRGEELMGRHTAVSRRTEIEELRPGRRFLRLRGAPVTQLVSVRYGPKRQFTDVSFLDSTSYDLIADTGQLYFLSASVPFWYSPGFVEVVYQGGMAADVDSFMAAYPAIAGATVLEVTNRLNRRMTPEGNLRAFDSQVAYEKPVEPLRVWLDAIEAHRRVLP